MAVPYRTRENGRAAPSRRDEYTLYQALVGAWPFGWDGRDGRAAFAARTTAFLEKAAKEAKDETSWTHPDPSYERGLCAFAERLLGDDRFVADVAAFCRGLEPACVTNALTQVLVRVCAPGVPDTYQGAELWHQPFVDPDNRGPVDFEARADLLARVRAGLGRGDRLAMARGLLARYPTGAIKLYTLHVALSTRARLRDVFLRGEYEPLLAGEHVIAFARTHEAARVVAVAPRLPLRLCRGTARWPIGEIWQETALALPSGRYVDQLTGRTHVVADDASLALRELLQDLPLALLTAEVTR
jgi:(1->4)-alpha-D-glucan 1-alpha-D-glucosylmutase